MQILSLETSTETASCALWRDGEVVERLCPVGRPHSETLLPLVRDLLGEAGIGFAQLDGIAVGIGPGAFTGLRVACGVAQGLAVAHALPVLPVIGLEAMALQSGNGRVLTLLDARMGEIYAGVWANAADGYALQGEIVVVPPPDVPLPAGHGWMACGNAPKDYPELAARLAAAGIAVIPDILPMAGAVARLAAPRLAAGKGIDAADLAPLYIRDKVAKTVAERLQEGGRA